MNALDQALAELESELDTPAAPAAVADADVIETAPVVEVVEAPEVAPVEEPATSTPVDELADLEAMLGIDADAVPEAVVATAADAPVESPVESPVDTINSDLDALEALLGEDIPSVTEADAVTLEAVEQELHLAETREELYEDTAPDAAGAVDLTSAEASKGETKPAKPVKMKARAHGASKPSAALIARLGSVEAVETHLRIEAGDSELSTKDLAELLKERMASLDTLPKKVGEKAVNLIAHLAGNAKLSCYTEIALEILLETGELSSKTLYDRYKARPYSEGTSRSQCGQLMQLLPAMGIAERPTTGSLTLVKDSPMANAIREAMKSAA
ncbi:hypothetical protein [Aeromonas caviae]|uniref:hypothetical protein n=1 Tax=Aeromonas caviae TaxID=648 RepID=UPI001CC686E6|nr:hypothetical protein [Aeromonas caviae]GJA98245.1 hypothetical protein KAM359_16530 [Aeromonas caviae]GJB45777.1 hypothetical protein KAM370_17190 [Aeromonas caviae]GJB50665.1 hypothetical protein KAM372_21260 [Aeromonas caviae]GJB54665.1 hypothetical protein KAM373_16600 [Aeromonas caviae]GJB72977.1 hypothetical protein KAM379_20350 [Aeromonas caviae]